MNWMQDVRLKKFIEDFGQVKERKSQVSFDEARKESYNFFCPLKGKEKRLTAG